MSDINNILQRVNENVDWKAEEKDGHIIIEGFTNLAKISFSLSNFENCPPAGFCIDRTFVANQGFASFTIHTSGNKNRCIFGANCSYVSFGINGGWSGELKEPEDKIYRYLDYVREKLIDIINFEEKQKSHGI